MLSANTAARRRSIWDAVSEGTFEKNLRDLSQRNFVPKPHALVEEDWPKTNKQEDRLLPFAVEKQLADDFAFIAAYEYGVRYVTVATIEPTKEPCSLTVRLAANEGICDRVKSALNELFVILERCAKKELSRDQCAENALDIVVTLNSNRLLGRLASSHFQRPAYEYGKSPESPAVFLKKCVVSRISSPPSISLQADTETFSAQVDEFHSSFVQLESAMLGEKTTTIKRMLKEAFSLTGDGKSFASRLEAMQIPTRMIYTKEIHQISKIANYWRVCQDLAHLSRSYRDLFANLYLTTIDPYYPVSGLGKHRKFVHAEFQMVIHYELSSPAKWPRAIGASKEACFLCDSFVRAHGCFYLSKAHRGIFTQWTVPNLRDFNNRSLKRLRETLATVNQDILQAIEQARSTRIRQPFPLQSSINLQKVILPTPSVTTVHSSGNDSVSGVSLIRDLTMSTPPTPRPISNVGNSLAKDLGDDNILPVQPTVTSGSTIRISHEWLDVYIQLEARQIINDNDITFYRADVLLEPVSAMEAMDSAPVGQRIDIGNLKPGDEKMIDRFKNDGGGTEPKLEFVLENGACSPVRFICRWYN